MRKLFTILSIVLLYSTIAFGQLFSDDPAAVAIPFTVEDNDGHSGILVFGLDLTATGGIDPGLDEVEQPPVPPSGVFDRRFVSRPGQSTLGQGTLIDIRNAPAFPFSGTYEHQIAFQTGGAGTEITVSWNLPPEIITGSVIQDLFGGVLGYDEPFVGTGSITVTNPALVTGLQIIVVYLAIIPVELTSFTAGLSGQEVILNWTTATEINNQGFEIERHTTTSNWETIGYVPGFGTTTEPKTYSYTDDNIVTGTYTYRLKQVDYDGTFSYSDEVEVEVDFAPSDFALFQNYPNPFNPSTSVRFQVPQTSSVTVIIYNMLGQEVRTLFAGEVVRGTYTASWNGLNDAGIKMSSGSYIYKMVAGDFVQSKKMVLLK